MDKISLQSACNDLLSELWDEHFDRVKCVRAQVFIKDNKLKVNIVDLYRGFILKIDNAYKFEIRCLILKIKEAILNFKILTILELPIKPRPSASGSKSIYSGIDHLSAQDYGFEDNDFKYEYWHHDS